MVNKDKQLDTLFSALSDATRRNMLSRLATKQMSVAELSEPFAMSKPAITKHLKVLEQAGLIQRHIDGRIHRCELQAAPLNAASQWLQFYEKFWNNKFDQLDAFLEGDK